jgi:nicotinate phosphoribosyltransferase
MFDYNNLSPLYTDYYQITMAQSYFKGQRHETPACFDYFFRKIPNNGGYVIFAGLGELLLMLDNLQFKDEDIDYLEKLGFGDDFLDYLKEFRFKGSIYGMREGEVVFPFEPILRVEGTLIETQLIETLLLNVLNFQSLIATKASRIRFSAGNRLLSDFGLRRAQSFGGISASRAAIIGGFDNTSNVYSANLYDIQPAGTMAHSFIESHDDELEAFRNYAKTYPDNCTLLVDTYNTLRSGVPNAIIVAKELEAKGKRLNAIRLDSGDLAYLAKKARKMLDHEGLDYVKIIVSNQLDEYVVKSLLDQKAPIDIFGVGTSMITGSPDGALDGVYKLSAYKHIPRLKISENVQKTTLPGVKKVYRFLDHDTMFHADCICMADDPVPERMIHPFEKEKSLDLSGYDKEDLFVCHMDKGVIHYQGMHVNMLREWVSERLKHLPEEHKRFDFPHIYKVGISDHLSALRDELINKYQKYM